MLETFLFVMTALLLVISCLREYFAYVERNQLVDRLMAKSLPEYKDTTTPEPNHLEPSDPHLMDIADAKEEILDAEE